MKKLIAVLSLFFTVFVLANSGRMPVSNTLTDFIQKFQPVYISLLTNFSSSPKVFRIVKFGYNLDVDVGSVEHIWSTGGEQICSTIGETIEIVSDSIQDNAGGTGASSVFVDGLDENGLYLIEYLDLNGTTPVTTLNKFIFINRLAITAAGSSRSNVGTISSVQSTSRIATDIIDPDLGVSQHFNYRVPYDRRCYINKVLLSTDKLSGGATPRVTFVFRRYNPLTTVDYVLRREIIDTSAESSREYNDFKSVALESGEIFYIEVETTTNDTEVHGTIDVTCMTNL